MSAPTDPTKSRHLAGLIVGIVLGLATLAFAWLGITTHGYGVIGVAWLALWVGMPLLMLQAGISLYYLLRKRPPARVWAGMWLPTLLAALVVPLHGMQEDARLNAQWARYPAHAEVHVNLTGRTLLPDVKDHDSTTPPAMAGEQPYQFLRLMRYPSLDSSGQPIADTADEGYAWLYAGNRMAPQATNMARHFLPNADTPTASNVRVPLITPQTYPELQDLSDLTGPIESALQFRYYHYPDRTEVGVALHLSLMQEMALWRRPGQLVQVVVFTTGPEPIARLQINGQEIDLGQTQAPAPPGHPAHDADCRLGGAWARLPFRGEWDVRWHSTHAPFAWQSARVQLPEFPGGEDAPGKLRAARVHLTITGANTMAVERIQERTANSQQSAIRVAGQVPVNAPCSPATRLVDPAAIRILPP